MNSAVYTSQQNNLRWIRYVRKAIRKITEANPGSVLLRNAKIKEMNKKKKDPRGK